MKPLLVVIDMQKGFMRPQSEHVISPVLNLIKVWRGDKIFTKFQNLPASQYERLLEWNRLREPSDTDLVPEIAPIADPILGKNLYSCFTPRLESEIARSGWDTFLLCGVATDSCILKTAVDAFERDFTPIVARDACASHGPPGTHDAALHLIERFIGKKQVLTTAAALQRLQPT